MFNVLFLLIISVCCSASDEFYSLKAMDIQENEVFMENYRGKVLLILNVASECGYTKNHYTSLTKLYNILSHSNKFTILAFPCNQFGNQEPAANSQIEFFIRTHYQVQFPMFSKIDVTGSNAHPIFKFLSTNTNQTPDWNFWKYLVDHEGNVTGVWGPSVSVDKIFDTVKALVDKAEQSIMTETKSTLKENQEL